MKKWFTVFASLLLVLRLTAVPALGSDVEDPLISRSGLEDEFGPVLEMAAAVRLNAPAAEGGNTTLKEGDILKGQIGMTFTLLRGEVYLSSGTVVDVTEGLEAKSGLLYQGHQYIAAEEVVFTVESPVAAAVWEGGTDFISADGPDYFETAKALQVLGLFRGDGSVAGEGFSLERTPSRGEALVLFLRLLGEEGGALACDGGHPFDDVPEWLDPYVAWAYRQGYSNGIAPDAFAPDRAVSAAEFVELLLRAIGHSSVGMSDVTGALERGVDCGLLSQDEAALLKQGDFRRAHAVSIAYQCLDVVTTDGQSLAGRLAGKGVFSPVRLAAVRSMIKFNRLC